MKVPLIKRRKKLITILALILLFITFFTWKTSSTGWSELSSSERKTMQEHKVEIGSDYIYCMKVKASIKSYDDIITRKKLNKNSEKNILFPDECQILEWWKLPQNIEPEFLGSIIKDSLDLVIRVDDIIYFSSQSW
ncbi:MAG: hypothetical protein GY705_04715 [Bacteroidetes bacterium]|nr:hypothetical protein [Bacteroidota bacterium]